MRKQRRNDILALSHDHTHRVSRGYEVNGQWYFELRGGGQKGSFDTEKEMLEVLNSLIQLFELMNQKN
ncbi:MAG TPA: hypothetical protein ENJ08_03475 [Gammaproteobacteria bacterium]|nr:hypothetical protein [Gammaproteobacteria bacterium]